LPIGAATWLQLFSMKQSACQGLRVPRFQVLYSFIIERLLGGNFEATICVILMSAARGQRDGAAPLIRIDIRGMTANSLIGQTIDRYQIAALLGRGGMATVYRAHDMVLRRDVALKVLYAHFASDAASVARFEQEAITAARLEHPNIVPIYDVGHVGDLLFISMKLLTGQSFHDMLAVGGVLDGRRVLLLAEQIASALDYAHSRGVVHRDIKPANMFIERAPSADGGTATRALLTDFGIAKSLDAPGTTTTGTMIGTPDYMAPEQIQGQLVDARADVYAFGMVLYRALAGR
jgi:eukaryotic-like serine/threonine-protein kinase